MSETGAGLAPVFIGEYIFLRLRAHSLKKVDLDWHEIVVDVTYVIVSTDVGEKNSCIVSGKILVRKTGDKVFSIL